MLLDKNSILSAKDLKRETVPCPEWGGDIIIQEISALDRDRLWPALVDGEGKNDPINLASKVLVRCIVAEDGTRIFCDAEADDLGKKSSEVINRLFKVAERLNTLTVQDAAIKNSAPGQNDSLPSASV
ncbi:MAG: hypothetical protein HGA20_15020 [Geobacteraceae bacterium]|nr:hypothetical protein [Geobacteraceae bacterium]